MDPNALTMVRALLQVTAVFSMVAAVFPILWGEIRVKWLVTGLTACVMFGLTGLMFAAVAPEVDVTALPVERGHDMDVGVMKVLGWVLAIAMLLYGAAMAVGYALDLRDRRTKRREARLASVDPVKVAERNAPEMVDEVRTAMARIERLHAIGGTPGDATDADAIVLAEKRLPSLMERHATAARAAASDAERADLARAALTTVVHIGKAAEDARMRIAGGLRGDLDTEARYISMRTGAAALGLD